MKKYYVFDIDWDVDYPEDLENLPTETIIEAKSEDEIVDALSDEFGFCVKSYCV